MDNARNFSSRNAAVVIENSAFTVEKAAALLDDYFNAPEKWQDMGRQMGELADPDAAGAMLAEISAALC